MHGLEVMKYEVKYSEITKKLELKNKNENENFRVAPSDDLQLTLYLYFGDFTFRDLASVIRVC